ncbi:hypothetical protein RLIN73S_01752 [Rhodanobacter lindaniclasticus]
MPQISSMNSQAKPSTRSTRSSPSVPAHGIVWRSTPPARIAGVSHNESARPSSAVPVISQAARLWPRSRISHVTAAAAKGRQRMTLGRALSGIGHCVRWKDRRCRRDR